MNIALTAVPTVRSGKIQCLFLASLGRLFSDMSKVRNRKLRKQLRFYTSEVSGHSPPPLCPSISINTNCAPYSNINSTIWTNVTSSAGIHLWWYKQNSNTTTKISSRLLKLSQNVIVAGVKVLTSQPASQPPAPHQTTFDKRGKCDRSCNYIRTDL